MHGIVFQEFKNYVTEEYGEDTWRTVVDEAEPSTRVFLATNNYPDEDSVALFREAADEIGVPVRDMLEEFGTFIGPKLLDMYGGQIQSEWDALDLIENTEEQIHRIVRADKPNASPPELDVDRTGDDEVLLVYQSDREMCGFAMGIARSVGDRYGESLRISEPQCMLDGATHCEIAISR